MAIELMIFLQCGYLIHSNLWLVGGFKPSEKYEFVNGKDYNDYPIYYEKQKMFQTTKQLSMAHINLRIFMSSKHSNMIPFCRFNPQIPDFNLDFDLVKASNRLSTWT